MKTKYRIIKTYWANEYGDQEKIQYYIQEQKMWFVFTLPIPHWVNIKEDNYQNNALNLDTLQDAELFIETVLKRNKPRLTTVETPIKQYE
jgi:hypothetical protein